MFTSPGSPEINHPLTMYRAEDDDLGGATQVRTDAYVIGEALWAPDGSGAVIVDAEASVQANIYPFTGPLLFLKSDGSAVFALPGHGRALRWGK